MSGLQEAYGYYYLYAGPLSSYGDTEMQPGRPLPHSHPSVQPVVHLGATQCSRKGAIWPRYEITTDLQAVPHHLGSGLPPIHVRLKGQEAHDEKK